MSVEWITLDSFAGITYFNPVLPLDKSLWIGRTINEGNYEPESTRFIRDYLYTHDNLICVDVGANIGYYTLIMGFLGEKVYAFEPATKYYKLLRECCEKNNIMDKCILSDKAISNKEARFHLSVYQQSATFHEPGSYSPEEVQEVSLDTMDNIIKERVDLIKTDCDGHDPFVLYGAERIIQEHKPVILIEVAPAHYEKAGFDLESFYWYLTSLNYMVCSEVDPTKTISLKEFVAYRERKDISSFNAICFPKP